MPMMIDFLLMVIAFRHIALCSAEINVTQSLFFDTGNDDLIFDAYVLLDVMARSQFDCARACLAKYGCDAYTFVRGTHMTSSGSCRLYSGFLGSGPAVNKIGATTFAKKMTSSVWLRQTCVNSADCPGDLTSCHVGQCLCQPSAYYSNGATTCVQSCQHSDLGSTFVTYINMEISHNLNIYIDGDGVDKDELIPCLTECVSINDCHAIVHGDGESSFNSCWPARSFAPGQTTSAQLPWVLYKRTCA